MSVKTGGDDLEHEDIVLEDPALILERRAREDELCERMQQVVSKFDRYLEDKEKSNKEVDEQEVDEMGANLSLGGVMFNEDGTIMYRGWSRWAAVMDAARCFRVFSAESLSPARFFGGVEAAATCKACRWLLQLPSWPQVLRHAQPFAQRTGQHLCPITRAYPRYLLFLMSVCDDELAVRRFHRALTACHFEEPLTLRDFMTVFYNWGFKEELLLYNFKPSLALQGMEPKEKPETDSKEARSVPEEKQGEEARFPVYFLAVSCTLKFMINHTHQLHLQVEDEDLVVAGLRMFVAAQQEKSVNFCIYNLLSLIYEMFDSLEVSEWPEQKRLKLVSALHMREFNLFDQFSCVKALVNTPNIKGPVCFAILQLLHGVKPDEVVYVAEMRAAHLKKLPPGPVDWAELSLDHIYLSLRVLADCACCVAGADAEDPALHAGLLHSLYRLQHCLPRMSLLDLNAIKTLISHLELMWKELMRDNLEKRNDVSFMQYMRDLHLT